jgi:signal transduction histidine kinase
MMLDTLEAPVATAQDEVPQLLLVDDVQANLEALELMLASSGCRFVQARSADEALLALLNQDFAAIVLDIRMPGMSGFELANLIKRRRRNQSVPILFLTAHMMDERDILEGYGAGAVDYLTKPINPEILRSKVAVFVDLHRKTRQLSRANEALQREVAERMRAEEALKQANLQLEARVEERTAALREADRRKDEFLAALAHELRNPLAALRSAAEVMRLKAPLGAELAMPQGVIERQLRQMTRLIDDLLDVSRITRAKVTLQKEKVELRKVLAVAVETIRPAIEQKGHTLSLSIPPDPVYLDADVVRLAQAFTNLLDNASKYTESGGRIRLLAEPFGNAVVVRIRDSGIGMEPGMLERVFDLFQQAHESPGAHGGLGIGLTLARKFVEMHGGTVTGHSDGPGTGCEFVVRLPSLFHNAEMDQPLDTDVTSVALSQSLRILIVEDNRDAADTLNAMLVAWGQETRVTYDALAAIEMCKQFRPHAVLLDIGLPQLHGYEVARRIRELPSGKDTKLVAVTGWGQEADRIQSKAAGIDHHLLKPVDPVALKTLLATFEAWS